MDSSWKMKWANHKAGEHERFQRDEDQSYIKIPSRVILLLMGEEPCSWSVLSPDTHWRPMIHAPTDCEEQGGYFCCDINDCRYRLRAEDMERFCEDLSSHSLSQSNILEGSHWRELLKSVIRMLKCKSLQLRTSSRSADEEGFSFFFF